MSDTTIVMGPMDTLTVVYRAHDGKEAQVCLTGDERSLWIEHDTSRWTLWCESEVEMPETGRQSVGKKGKGKPA